MQRRSNFRDNAESEGYTEQVMKCGTYISSIQIMSIQIMNHGMQV